MASLPLRSVAQGYAQHFMYLNGVDIVILTTIFISQIAYCDLLLIIKGDHVKLTLDMKQTFLIT